MKFKVVWTLIVIVVLGLAKAAHADGTNDRAADRTSAEAASNMAIDLPVLAQNVPNARRPSSLPVLYGTLSAVQVWDLYSTSLALKSGAHEANPNVAPFTSSRASMLALKAATTAGAILCAEKMWRKNRTGAVVMMVAINVATAAVAQHNIQIARLAAHR